MPTEPVALPSSRPGMTDAIARLIADRDAAQRRAAEHQAAVALLQQARSRTPATRSRSTTWPVARPMA